mgnify:CR=1 FL=1
MTSENSEKSSIKYLCKTCDYYTSRKSQYERHLATPKHQNNTNTTNNIQNIVHNHFKIEGFGKENILDVITDKEKKLILNQGCESIEKLIEIIYIGKHDQFKNVLITNKRENDIYTYDDKSGLYINNDKNLVLNKLVISAPSIIYVISDIIISKNNAII